jgi:hypothetical protein
MSLVPSERLQTGDAGDNAMQPTGINLNVIENLGSVEVDCAAADGGR